MKQTIPAFCDKLIIHNFIPAVFDVIFVGSLNLNRIKTLKRYSFNLNVSDVTVALKFNQRCQN